MVGMCSCCTIGIGFQRSGSHSLWEPVCGKFWLWAGEGRYREREAVLGLTANLFLKNVFLNHLAKYFLSPSSQKCNLMATDNTECKLTANTSLLLEVFFCKSLPSLVVETRQQFVGRDSQAWRTPCFLVMAGTASWCECPQALALLSGASECWALSCREAVSTMTTAFRPKPGSSRLKNHHLAWSLGKQQVSPGKMISKPSQCPGRAVVHLVWATPRRDAWPVCCESRPLCPQSSSRSCILVNLEFLELH